MANELTVVEQADLTKDLASLYRVTPGELIKTVKAQCFPGGAASDAQLVMFLTVCRERKLNPFMKEVYAFMQGGKMQIGVEIDGWIRKANEHPQYDGCSFDDSYVNDKLFSVTCKIFRKDRKHAGEYTALFSEWNVSSNQVWKDKPRHMLGIKAFNQCARFTLGLTGITDEEAQEFAGASGAASAPVVAEEPEEAVVVAVDEETGEVVGATPPEELNESAAGAQAESESSRSAGSTPAPAQPPYKTVKEQVAAAMPENAKIAEEEKKRGRPKSAKTKLKEMNLPSARITVICGQAGVAKLDDLTEEQAAAAVARLEKRGK
jgi:phage recombination protein Bet